MVKIRGVQYRLTERGDRSTCCLPVGNARSEPRVVHDFIHPSPFFPHDTILCPSPRLTPRIQFHRAALALTIRLPIRHNSYSKQARHGISEPVGTRDSRGKHKVVQVGLPYVREGREIKCRAVNVMILPIGPLCSEVVAHDVIEIPPLAFNSFCVAGKMLCCSCWRVRLTSVGCRGWGG